MATNDACCCQLDDGPSGLWNRSSPAAGVHALVARRGLFPERLGTPVEYGELALMLLTLDYLNAEVVRMDGGIRMAPKLADRPAIMPTLTD